MTVDYIVRRTYILYIYLGFQDKGYDMRRLTHEKFISRVWKRYPKLRVITEYRNTRTPIQMRCTKKDMIGKLHGIFIIRDVSAFLHGKNNRNGCKKRSNESRSKSKTQNHYDYFNFPNFENCYSVGYSRT